MLKSTAIKFVSTGLAGLMLCACEQLPGTRKEQGAVIGGAAGAATGAVLAKGNRGLGAILGGLIGAGGGYVIGAQTDKVHKNDTAGATTASQNAQQNPATVAQAQTATTADLNGDGFVTLDEVVAMKQAGFSDQKMIDYMRSTGQIFELSADQQQYLRDHGVSQNVITQMASLNQGAGSSSAPPNVISTQPNRD